MYDPSRIQSSDVQDLLSKIICEPDESADLAWFNEHRMCYLITITLSNDKQFVLETEFPRDKPDIGWAEIERKFRELANGSLLADAIEQVIDMVDSLEKLDDVAQLARLLTT